MIFNFNSFNLSQLKEFISINTFLIGRWKYVNTNLWEAYDVYGNKFQLQFNNLLQVILIKENDQYIIYSTKDNNEYFYWISEKFGIYLNRLDIISKKKVDRNYNSDLSESKNNSPEQILKKNNWNLVQNLGESLIWEINWQSQKLQIEVNSVEFYKGLLVVYDINWSDMNLNSFPPLPEFSITGQCNISKNNFKSLNGGPIYVGHTMNCSHNNLLNLVGSPKKVGGSFNCAYNNLVTLLGAPNEIGSTLSAQRNKLESLIGIKHVNSSINIAHNKLKNLKYSPKKVYGTFDCTDNLLSDLKNAPEHVEDNFKASHCQLSSLNGRPNWIGGLFDVSSNNLTNIKNLPDHMGRGFNCANNPIIFNRN